MGNSFYFPPKSSGIYKFPTFLDFPATAEDGAVAIALDADVMYIFDLPTGNWLPIGGTSTILGAGNTDSITHAVLGNIVYADLNLSIDSADVGYMLIENDIRNTLGQEGLRSQIPYASATTDGALSQGDWNTFNDKLDTVAVDGVTITGDGTSGNPLTGVAQVNADYDNYGSTAEVLNKPLVFWDADGITYYDIYLREFIDLKDKQLDIKVYSNSGTNQAVIIPLSYINNKYVTFEGLSNLSGKIKLALYDDWTGVQMTDLFPLLKNIDLTSVISAASPFNLTLIGGGTKEVELQKASLINDVASSIDLITPTTPDTNITFYVNDNSKIENNAAGYIINSSQLAPAAATLTITETQAATEDVTTLNFNLGVPTSGDWALEVNGFATSTYAYNETAANIEADIQSLDASLASVTVTGDETIGFTITFIGCEPTTCYVVVTSDTTGMALGENTIAGQYEQQTITPNLPTTSGSTFFDYGADTSLEIYYNDDAGNIQNALNSISALSSVAVTGSMQTGFVVTFVGVIGDASLLVENTNTLQTGGTVGTVKVYLTNSSRLIGEMCDITTPLEIYYDNTSTYDLQINPLVTYTSLATSGTVSPLHKSQYLMTASSAVGEQLDLVNNAWSNTGASTYSGDVTPVTMPTQTDFDDNECTFQLNGVELDKGVGLDVEFVSADVVQFNFAVLATDIVRVYRRY